MNLFSSTQQQPPREHDAVSLPPSLLRGGVVLLVLLLATGIDLPAAKAAGARTGGEAMPGEIVLIRDVPKRVAYHNKPDAQAVLLDVGPEEDVEAALGQGELNDLEFATVTVPANPAQARQSITSPTNELAQDATGAGQLSGAALGIQGTTSSMASSLGSIAGHVTGVTAGIGRQVTDSLASMQSTLGTR